MRSVKAVTMKYGTLLSLILTVIMSSTVVSMNALQSLLLSVVVSQTQSNQSSGFVDGNINLAQDVLDKSWIVEKYLLEEGLLQELPYLLAIMMVESGGKGDDPMQSSESAGLSPGALSGVEQSIKQGVLHYKQALKNAEIAGMGNDRKAVVQAYNFGSFYPIWLGNHELSHSVDIAEGYSKNIVAPSLGNTNGKTYPYVNVISEADGRTYLYSNGGNFFYAELVFQYLSFTGDFIAGEVNAQIVNVASTQIGNQNGQPYWTWYGFNYRVEWCAVFVSWVADQSGYLHTAIPKFAYVPTGIEWFKSKNQYVSRDYLPKAGDIIFFDWNGNNYGDHVGIVESVDGETVYAIEGNTNNLVARRQYALSSPSIMGYGIPVYD